MTSYIMFPFEILLLIAEFCDCRTKRRLMTSSKPLLRHFKENIGFFCAKNIEHLNSELVMKWRFTLNTIIYLETLLNDSFGENFTSKRNWKHIKNYLKCLPEDCRSIRFTGIWRRFYLGIKQNCDDAIRLKRNRSRPTSVHECMKTLLEFDWFYDYVIRRSGIQYNRFYLVHSHLKKLEKLQ